MQSIGNYLLFGLACFILPSIQYSDGATEYFGRYIGPMSRLLHSVSGEVYAVDARTLHIRDFTYDGEGPAAFFYAGNSKAPGPGGFIVRDETGSNGVLKRYNKKHITLTLPEGKTLNNIRWFSVWCEEFQVNFGDVQIPRGLDFPKPQKVGALSGVHGVSSDSIVLVDAQTLLIPSFSYDGEAPDAKFWVGRGPKPSPQGIRVPDENGKQNPLRRYDRKTIVLTLPGDLTVFDIGHFGVWCEAFTVDFGHVQIPPALNVPPSLKMLGVSPQSKLNCEVLSEELAYEVRWAVAGDSVVIQLVAKLEDGEYMSFGLSGEDHKSVMVGGDVVTAWVDQSTMNGYAQDYNLDSKSQCAGTRGSCPDYRIEPNTDSVRLLNAALVNGYSIVTYQRPLKAHDGLDKPILTNRSQPIIWAVGPLNSKSEVSYHSITSKGDIFLDFGRPPKWNCPIPESDATADSSNSGEVSSSFHDSSSSNIRTAAQRSTEAPQPVYKTPPPPSPAPTNGAWEIPPIQCNEPEDGVFYAQMGPTGGKRGYSAITGHVGWGISYYINGLLIPEINVVRGRTYTFVVEGGKDPNIPAKFHPFYITDDPVGGYQYKTPEERRKVNIYAGAELNKHGEVVPTGLGRLCNWTPDPEQPLADEFASFGAYQRTLTLVCDHGEPAVVQWTPDKDTPDTVYYQCFSHRYLGWKIRVHDRCDLPAASGSEPVPSVVLPQPLQDELQAKPSLIVTTRVKPDFPPQSIVDTKVKNFTKFHFPYEILKPAYNVKRPNISDEHIIPVKEEIEDIPQSSSTHKPGPSNLTLNTPTAMPLIKSPQPFRNGFGGSGNGRPPTRRPVLMIRRPLQPMMKPPQHMPLMNRPSMVHVSASQTRPVIMKKPLMRIPQRPMMMMQAGPVRPLMPQQPSVMPNRAPIKAVYVHKFKKPIQQTFITPLPEKTKYKMQPSQMISQNAEEVTTRLPIAVNTGFNPGSLVIESGFKPIIQAPHAEERVSEIEYEDSNEGVINMDSGEEQKSHTEMFEPMFIPSPLDSNTKHTKKATTEPVKKIRKPYRQVIIRRPIYTEEPLFRSEPDMDETTNDKVKSFYTLPTRSPTNVHSYDGKSVPEDEVPQVPPNHRPDSEQLKSSPQFDPFKGDIPPVVPNKEVSDITQLNLKPEAQPLKTEEIDKENVEVREVSAEPSEVEIVTVISVSKEERRQRKRRSAHHEAGHLEHHDILQQNQTEHSSHSEPNRGYNHTLNLLPLIIAIVAKFL